MTDRSLEHKLGHFFFDDLHLCGCGIPESAARLVRDVLRLAPFYENQGALQVLLPTDGIFYLVLGQLNNADLIEHGGCIGGSWLTEKGKELLGQLETVSAYDPELETLFPDSDVAPPEECTVCYPEELRG